MILFHRIGGEEVVQAFDSQTGTTLWKHAHPASYRDDFGFDPGPRATPVIASGKVFTFGAAGILQAVLLADGKLLWRTDCQREFGAAKGFFGLASSPLVEGKSLIVNVGGRDGAGLVAFNQETGKVQWKVIDDEPSYSSPVAGEVNGRRLLLACTRSYFVGLDTASGGVIFQLPFRPPVGASVTGASPVLLGQQVFISAGYDLGARLFDLAGGSPKTVWEGDDQLSLQFTTAVHRDGHLYGLHGRHDFPGGTELRCVEWKTGKVRWAKAGLNGANVILAGDQLLMLTEDGQLLRIAAQPEKYLETARAQILGQGVRAYPALANGLYYARDKSRLVCLDLK